MPSTTSGTAGSWAAAARRHARSNAAASTHSPARTDRAASGTHPTGSPTGCSAATSRQRELPISSSLPTLSTAVPPTGTRSASTRDRPASCTTDTPAGAGRSTTWWSSIAASAIAPFPTRPTTVPSRTGTTVPVAGPAITSSDMSTSAVGPFTAVGGSATRASASPGAATALTRAGDQGR